MSFKYINPGYANLLDVEGGTTIESTQKSSTGVALWQATADKGIDLEECPSELYGKFDVYLHHESDSDTTNVTIRVCLGGKNYNGIQIRKYDNHWQLVGYCNGYGQVNKTATTWHTGEVESTTGLKLEQINTIYFHIIPVSDDNSTGNLKIWVNGGQIADYNYSINFSSKKFIEIFSSSPNGLISNIILSDTEIHQREQVAIFPVSTTATETTMTDNGDGTYTSDTVGEQILQAVDVDALIEEYGEDSEIKGIAVIGNPAYRTAQGLNQLIAIEKNGNVITEYGAKTVSTDSLSGVMDGRAVSLTMAQLADKKFGWKTNAS